MTPGMEALLPEGGLAPGAIYSVSPHASVMWALIAEATNQGHYVASVGLEHLGFRAAVEYGVSLDHLIVVPRAGRRWWPTVASLVDVVSVVVVLPEGPLPSPTARDTLIARARERGCALLVIGDWPHAHGHIRVDNTRLSGLGRGWGVLASHELTLSYRPRRGASSYRVTLLRDGTGSSVVSSKPTPPVRHLTPRSQEGVVFVGDHREAG